MPEPPAEFIKDASRDPAGIYQTAGRTVPDEEALVSGMERQINNPGGIIIRNLKT